MPNGGVDHDKAVEAANAKLKKAKSEVKRTLSQGASNAVKNNAKRSVEAARVALKKAQKAAGSTTDKNKEFHLIIYEIDGNNEIMIYLTPESDKIPSSLHDKKDVLFNKWMKKPNTSVYEQPITDIIFHEIDGDSVLNIEKLRKEKLSDLTSIGNMNIEYLNYIKHYLMVVKETRNKENVADATEKQERRKRELEEEQQQLIQNEVVAKSEKDRQEREEKRKSESRRDPLSIPWNTDNNLTDTDGEFVVESVPEILEMVSSDWKGKLGNYLELEDYEDGDDGTYVPRFRFKDQGVENIVRDYFEK